MKNLIIAGVHKAGTTSLFTYLSWHPKICVSEIKETHFFSDESFLKKHTSYLDYFSGCPQNSIFVEASPEYIYGKKKTARKIKENLNDVKLIFILRNPTDKIISSFKHRKKNLLFDKNYMFTDFYNDFLKIKSLNELEEGVDKHSEYTTELLDGCYIDYIPLWYDVFNASQIKVLFFEDLKNNPKEVLSEICDWELIDKTIYDNREFTVENKSVVFKYKILQKITLYGAKKMEPVIRKNYQLKNALRSIYYSINLDNSNSKKEDENQEVHFELTQLYSEKNLKLKQFLLKKGYNKFPEWL